MSELCLMASCRCPPDIGVVLHSDQGYNRFSEDVHNFLPHQGSNEERPTSVQGARPDSKLFSFGIADKCSSQKKILKLIASGSMGVENGLLDLSMIHDLMGHLDFAPFTQQPLIYPTKDLYYNEPFGEYLCYPDGQLQYNYLCYPDGQLQYNSSGTELNDVITEMYCLYSSKNTNKSSKQTMLVPFLERRKRAQARIKASNLVTENAGPLKSHDKARGKASQTKSSTRIIKEREKSYLHMCEILLSILVNKEQQQTKKTIHSLKKSSPRLPEMLTQRSATIFGAGIAVVLSVLCRVACNKIPFCASKILSTGLGLGLISLSWAVHKQRDTIVSICEISGKMNEEEEEMMNCLERNMKDIYFRAVAVMAVAVLRLV